MANPRTDHDRAASALHLKLLRLQSRLIKEGRGAVVVIGGNDRLAASGLANRLQEWFDARTVEVVAPLPDDPALIGRPFLWPYWVKMPAKGRMTLVVGDWVTRTAVAAAKGEHTKDSLRDALRRLRQFEELLLADGVALAKVWLTTSRKDLRRRLRITEDTEAEGWTVTKDDLLLADGPAARVAAECQRLSSPVRHNWRQAPGVEAKARDLAAGRIIFEQLSRPRARLAKPRPASRLRPRGLLEAPVQVELSKDDYSRQIRKWQVRLGQLSRLAARRGISTLVVLEGPDAAGKGGITRRLASLIDAGHLLVHPTPAPTPEEKARHYLWRFWTKVPSAGRMAVFDRSWYGRILVERVEGFCRTLEWQRAYAEINAFESRLAEAGAVVLKFWLQLSKEEQWRRFKLRTESPHKRHKMTSEDHRNRAKWDLHAEAAEDMVARTDTPHAPWHVVPADNKRAARVTVLRTLARALADRLER